MHTCRVRSGIIGIGIGVEVNRPRAAEVQRCIAEVLKTKDLQRWCTPDAGARCTGAETHKHRGEVHRHRGEVHREDEVLKYRGLGCTCAEVQGLFRGAQARCA